MGEKEEYIRSLIQQGKNDAEIQAALATWKPTGKPVAAAATPSREDQVRAMVRAGKTDAEITAALDPHQTRRVATRGGWKEVPVEGPDALSDYDQTTGGPENVRMRVMAAGSNEDKLAAAREMMPNASVHMTRKGPAFIDPSTNKMTLITPSTLKRMGTSEWWLHHQSKPVDAVEALPEIINGISALGSAFIPGGVPARIAAAGAINAAGQFAGQGAAKLANRLTGNTAAPDTRSAGDLLLEGGVNAAAGSAGEAIGPLLPKLPGAVAGAARAIRTGTRELASGAGASTAAKAAGAAFKGAGTTVTGAAPSELAETMMRQGITNDGETGLFAALKRRLGMPGNAPAPAAPLSVLSDSPAIQNLGIGIETGLGGGAISEAKKQTVKKIEQRVGDIATFEGKATPRDEVAATVRKAVQGNTADYTNSVNQLKKVIFDGEAGAKTIDPTHVRNTLERMQEYVGQYPESRTPRFDAAIEQLQRVVNDAAERTKASAILDASGQPIQNVVKPAGIRISELKDIMSDVGEMQAKAAKGMADGKAGVAGAKGPLTGAYDALNTEIRNALGDTPAGRALDGYNSLVKSRRSLDNVAGEKVMQAKLRGQNNLKSSMDLLMTTTPDESGARAIRAAELRRTTDTDTWKGLTSHRLGQLGREGGETNAFSLDKLVADLEGFSEKEQAAWGLSETQRKNLSEIRTLTRGLKERGIESTVSGGSTNARYVFNKVASTTLPAVGAAAGAAALTHNPMIALATLTGVQAAQNGVARAMASPTLGRWLTTTMRVVDKNPRALAAQLSRLLVLKKTHKALSPDIDAIYQSFQQDEQQ